MKFSDIGLIIAAVGFCNFTIGYFGYDFTGSYFAGNVLGGLITWMIALIFQKDDVLGEQSE